MVLNPGEKKTDILKGIVIFRLFFYSVNNVMGMYVMKTLQQLISKAFYLFSMKKRVK